MNIASEYIEIFNSHRKMLDARCGAEVNAQREMAYAKFSELGFPNEKDEDYRYTPVASYFSDNYGLDLEGKTAHSNKTKEFSCDVPGMDAYTIYLINGWYYTENIVEQLPEGVILCGFAEASKKHPELFAKYYNQKAKNSKDGVVFLNTMLAQDGLFLYVPKNVIMDKPIQIVNLLGAKMDLLSTQRSLFILEDFAKAQILICDHTLTKQSFTANHVRELFVGDNAFLEYYLIENQHNKVNQIISSFIHQQKNSNVHSNVVTLHNGNTRNNTFVTLAGENANSELYGVTLTDKQQHVDNFTEIDHAVPHCTSTELFKYVMDDNSTGAFKGRIVVQPDAQHTEAYQTNNNICLSKDAKINTRPQLEIYADDVKCSHGATVGQLDEEALFYMQTRGISPEEARMLLMFAFTHEVVNQVRLESLKERLKFLIEQRLRGEISKYQSCAMCN